MSLTFSLSRRHSWTRSICSPPTTIAYVASSAASRTPRSETTPPSKPELADKIVEELEIHTTIEEEIFYPTVHDLSSEIGDSVDEGLEEHHVAKTLIGELKPLKAGSDQWVAKMKVLIESVEHHAEEEENEMFPKVRSATDAVEAGSARREARSTKGRARRVRRGRQRRHLPSAELRQKASEQEIPGRSKMDREELAATVDPE